MQKLHIIKIGGNILDDAEKLKQFLKDFASLEGQKLLVHGGGKIASAMGHRLGITPKMLHGRRITDAETLELVTMVYGGLVNKQVIAQLQALGCNAIGLTGADANIIKAVKRPAGEVDYGFAGDVPGTESINSNLLAGMLDLGLTPVFAPLTHDGQGSLLNTNADTIASVLATALAARYHVRLIYCFEKKGVLQNAANDASVIPVIDKAAFEALKQSGAITAGMLPKLENAFGALAQGVHSVKIGDAADICAMAAEGKCGTLLTKQL